GIDDVPNGSGSIPTASTPAKEQVPTCSDVVPTASPVFATATVVTPYKKRKGKEVMVDSETPKNQKVQKQMDAQVSRELEERLEREDQRKVEQIARDTEIARIHAEEELQSWKVKDFKGMTFEEVEAKFNSVWKQIEDFIHMGSKEEAERIKRKGLKLEQESAKKQKTSEEFTKKQSLLMKSLKRREGILFKEGSSTCDDLLQASSGKLFSDGKVVITLEDLDLSFQQIGSLMYVTSSRPNIMFATCMCVRYQANPNEHHVSAIKRIFRYLKGTINLGLWYPKDYGFDLTTYLDADHARCPLDRKSTFGSVQFLGDKLVCWSSKKQNYVSISIAESEYVAVSSCCAQVLWMRTQLMDYGFFYDKVPIYCDSKSVIAISCNLVQHSRTKHIDVRYHFIKDHVEKGTIELYFVGTEYQLADLFMKSLPEARFKFLVEKLGMMSRET
nr:retrovirus-related Pol polyprotein from transposon TNT 1-94 [Tanacetum cinerariifolium]